MDKILRTRELVKKWEKENPEKLRAIRHRAYLKRKKNSHFKLKARYMVRNWIRLGKIKKLPCEICGEQKVQAHHEDYSHPLKVRWLCHEHHYNLHHVNSLVPVSLKGML